MICHMIHIATHKRTIKNAKQPKRPAELSHQSLSILAPLSVAAPKRPQEKKCTAKNGDSEQAKHDYVISETAGSSPTPSKHPSFSETAPCLTAGSRTLDSQ